MLLPAIVPQGTPLAPADLLKLSVAVVVNRQSKANGLKCTLFCNCKVVRQISIYNRANPGESAKIGREVGFST